MPRSRGNSEPSSVANASAGIPKAMTCWMAKFAVALSLKWMSVPEASGDQVDSE